MVKVGMVGVWRVGLKEVGAALKSLGVSLSGDMVVYTEDAKAVTTMFIGPVCDGSVKVVEIPVPWGRYCSSGIEKVYERIAEVSTCGVIVWDGVSVTTVAGIGKFHLKRIPFKVIDVRRIGL